MPRIRLEVDGIVQGVGFRPFVFSLAEDLGLSGWVTNTSDGVTIEIEGPHDQLDCFSKRLGSDTPPLAKILTVTEEAIPEVGSSDFEIRHSKDSTGTSTLVPPDVATCADCLREIRDPADRRFGYPFTNCTNCGPRWTIIDRIPYDRPFTSMATFTMCKACRAEYENPRDRRFHAQPNACPDCGPQVRLVGDVVVESTGPLIETARLLSEGRIVAIKGLGGFHLAVRADDEAAVVRLRQRKHREAKPLALMTSIEDLNSLVVASNTELNALQNPTAPIVLMKRRNGAPIAPSIAPGHRRLGVMLPYTPLHHLLLDALSIHGISTLVMTSGNVGDEPICLDDDEARDHLANIADAWLLHDRPILRRADDSVIQLTDTGPLYFRRSRGWAPVPVIIRGIGATGPPILATGAELKNTVALLKENRCFVSPHVGDLENLATHDFFRETVRTLTDLFECEPEAIACDLHPGYLSSRWAQETADARSLPLIRVQHHHAHMVAVMSEHGLEGECLGLILDGTGYGSDGTIWGGELLQGDRADFRRVGHLSQFPLPGGDTAVRNPWRAAVSCLREAFGDEAPVLSTLAAYDTKPIIEMLNRDVNSPLTSSCGRLFDAVAALCGLCGETRYEAQGAIELTAATSTAAVRTADPFSWKIIEHDDRLIVDIPTLIRGIIDAHRQGADIGEISARFHRTLIEAWVEVVHRTAEIKNIRDVVLGGGSLQNEHLWTLLPEALIHAGLRPYLPRDLSPNDGGLCIGQALTARAILAR